MEEIISDPKLKHEETEEDEPLENEPLDQIEKELDNKLKELLEKNSELRDSAASTPESWTPNIILCGPGGVKACLILGCLKRLFLEESIITENIERWVGVSAGAAISLLIICGYSIDEIIDLFINVNIVDELAHIKLNEAINNLGFIKNKTVEEKLSKAIKDKFGYVPSLRQLYLSTGYILTVVVYNLDKMRPEFMDKDTEPDISCLEATMMSMAIPGLIQPRKYKGNMYIDGGIGAPYPVCEYDYNNNKILGIYIASENDLYSSDKNPKEFLHRLIYAGMKALREKDIENASSNVKHIVLKTTVTDTAGISTSYEDRMCLIRQGYDCAESFIQHLYHPEKFEEIKENEEISFL